MTLCPLCHRTGADLGTNSLKYSQVWSLRGTCQKHSYHPKLGRGSCWELQQRSALRCCRAPPQIPACPKALPPWACTGSSGTFWHLWAQLSLGQPPWSLWNTRKPWAAKLTAQNSCYRPLWREGSTCPSHPSWNIHTQATTPMFPLEPYPLPVTLYCDFCSVSSSGPTGTSQGLPVLAQNTNPAGRT